MVKGDTNIKPLKLDGSNGISAGMSYKSSPPFWLHIQPKENISRIKKQSYFSFLKRSEPHDLQALVIPASFGRGIFTHAIFAVPTPVVEIAISLAL